MENYNNLLNQLLEKSTFIDYSHSDPIQKYIIYFSGCSTEVIISSNKTDFFNIEFFNNNKKNKLSKHVNLSNLNIYSHQEFIYNLLGKHQYFLNGSRKNKNIDETLLSYLKTSESLTVFLKLQEKNTIAKFKVKDNFLFSMADLYGARLYETNQLYPLIINVINFDSLHKVVIPKYEYSKYPILNYLNQEIFTENPMDVISSIDDKKFISLFEQEYLLSSINNPKFDIIKSKI